MKRFLLLAWLIWLGEPNSFAQHLQTDIRWNRISPEEMVKRLDRTVRLDKSQEERLFTIFADYLSTMRTGQLSMKPKEKRLKKKELHQKVESILTPEQRQLWTSSKIAQKNKHIKANKQEKHN